MQANLPNKEYIDVSNLTHRRKYLVSCTQRIIIPSGAYSFGGGIVTSFRDYPAYLTNGMELAGDNFESISLLSYSPKTLNTAIISDISTSNSSGFSNSTQHTTGSSTAQTNSYGTSIDVGLLPSKSINKGNSHSHSTDKSSGTSHSSDQSSERSMAADFAAESDVFKLLGLLFL